MLFFGLLLLGGRGQTLVEDESESFLTLDFLRRRARSDMVMLPMAGTRGLWLRIASNVAETAPCKDNNALNLIRNLKIMNLGKVT